MKILKGLLMVITAPIILLLTLFVWFYTGLIYISGLVLGLFNMVIVLPGTAILITYSPQNGVILLAMVFLISPMGLPLVVIWLLGKVQSSKFAIQELVYGQKIRKAIKMPDTVCYIWEEGFYIRDSTFELILCIILMQKEMI